MPILETKELSTVLFQQIITRLRKQITIQVTKKQPKFFVQKRRNFKLQRQANQQSRSFGFMSPTHSSRSRSTVTNHSKSNYSKSKSQFHYSKPKRRPKRWQHRIRKPTSRNTNSRSSMMSPVSNVSSSSRPSLLRFPLRSTHRQNNVTPLSSIRRGKIIPLKNSFKSNLCSPSSNFSNQSAKRTENRRWMHGNRRTSKPWKGQIRRKKVKTPLKASKKLARNMGDINLRLQSLQTFLQEQRY